MKILVRLPNWLGDLVMSVAFLQELSLQYPAAEISVIIKKGIHPLMPFFPPVKNIFIFSKQEYKGLGGAIKFGRMVRQKERFDLFFSLPDSFSSALIGFATGAKERVGFKKEVRGFLLTKKFKKPVGLHRVEEYLALLELYTNRKTALPQVFLKHEFPKKEHVVVNINSEAPSRRLTVAKAVEEINLLRKNTNRKIILTGGPKEIEFVTTVYNDLAVQTNIENTSGNSLPALTELLASAALVLSTDSGPAHLANALGSFTIVLFGAGDEANTAPYNKALRHIIRLNKLSCEPCLKNTCQRYKLPQCLQQLDTAHIISKVIAQLEK